MKRSLLILLIVVLVLLVASVFMFFPNVVGKIKTLVTSSTQNQKTSNIATETQIKQSQALLATSQLTFSKVVKITPMSEDGVFPEFKEFILENPLKLSYNKIEYQGGKTGIFITYKVNDVTLMDASTLLLQKIKSWLRLTGSYASEFGFFDYTGNKDGSNVRVLIFQDGKNLKFNIKSETK